MIMLNEESFATFINIEVQGHCLTFIQGHLKPNFEILFTQKKLPGQLKLYLMLGLILGCILYKVERNENVNFANDHAHIW